MNDTMILSKAKNRVIAHIVFFYIFIGSVLFAIYYALTLDFFKNSLFAYSFLGIALGDALIILLAFIALASGKKWSRWLYWLAFLATLGFFYIPIKALLDDLPNFLSYGFCLGGMLVLDLILFQVGMYFYKNPYCRIYYDHILTSELEQKFMEQQQTERKLVIQQEKRVADQKEEFEEIEEEKEVPVKEEMTYPQLALRLGIGVYGELIVFPIIVQIFSNFFASYDLQQVFATREMFIFSIFTAFVWTIPVLYLYYNQPQSKKIVYGCILAEVLFLIYCFFQIKGYYDSGLYPIKAFLFFGLLDLARYAILAYFVKPILTSDYQPDKLQLP